MISNKSIGEKGFNIINYILLLLLSIITIYPFIYFIALSLNDGYDAMKGGIYLWPRVFTFDNYLKAFKDPNIVNAYKITLFRTIVGTAISTLLSAMAAFALMRKDLPGRKQITFFFFFTTIFSGGMIPFYVLLRQMHLLSSVWIYVFVLLFNFINIVLLRTFFEEIPISLLEASRIDGCNDISAFFKIYLPISKPVIATITLFYGVAHWNDWVTGTLYVKSKSLIPVASLLQQLLDQTSFEQLTSTHTSTTTMAHLSGVTPNSMRMTFVVVMTVPIICIYPFLQKYFTKGVMLGSIKG